MRLNKSKVDISIIIVNYKAKEELFKCIQSITPSKQNLNYEIIVVDNDEVKTIGPELRRKFPEVNYLKSRGNIGYGAGNNLGVKYAKNEYLFILNPDTKFNNGNLSKLVKFAELNKKVGAVAPLLLDKNNQPYQQQGGRVLTPFRGIVALSFIDKLFPNNAVSKNYRYHGWNKSKINKVDIVPGTAFVIKKELFKKIGGFDEKFFLFFEEFDFCYRLKKRGFKNYIHPGLEINHSWGVSTTKNPNSKKHFLQSRFYYFKKNFGTLKAVPVELILRIDSSTILMFSIICLALFLRLYRLSDIMPFIGDTAWFYVSARDLIIDGKIPLVGITTSHTWLHQGAFWTYILAFILKIFNFNPFAPSYFTSLLDIGALIIIYFFAKEVFNKKIALISSLLYATSPLIVSFTQVAYHTSIIPFFTTIFLVSVYKWIKGNLLFFPISIFLLVILYNLELATFSLTITTLLVLIVGVIKKKKWVIGIFKARILALSGLAFLIPMIPFFLYDISHGFPQTLKFVAWVLYRVAVFLGYSPIDPNAPGETWGTFYYFILDYIGRFYFIKNEYTALGVLFLTLLFVFYKLFISRFRDNGLGIVLIFFLVPAAAYILAKTNSAAYLPIFFPQAIIILGYFFGSFKKSLMSISILVLFFIVLINSHYVLTTNYFGSPGLKERIEKAREIIDLANGREYNLVGVGQGSGYESFILNQEYLTWWLGHAPSEKDQKLKFFVFPDGTIRVKEQL